MTDKAIEKKYPFEALTKRAEEIGELRPYELKSAAHVEALKNGMEEQRERVDGLVRTVKLMTLVLESEKTPDANLLEQVLPGEMDEYKRLQEAQKKNPNKFQEVYKTLRNQVEQFKKAEVLSDQAKQAKEKAADSLFGKIWNAVKYYGNKAMEGVKMAWEKVKEFASTRRGKLFLIGAGTLLVVAALVGGYYWLLSAPLEIGTTAPAKEALLEGVKIIGNASGSNLKFSSGVEQWLEWMAYLRPDWNLPIPSKIPIS
jgi:hypothetical protein